MGASLINGDFEADWSDQRSHQCLRISEQGDVEEIEQGIIFTPPGWLVWFRYQEDRWAAPEGRATSGTNPKRMHSGEKGYLLFTVGQAHDSGLLQELPVKPGETIRFSAWAHGWSNQQDPSRPDLYPNPDDSCWSEGAGHDPFFALEGELSGQSGEDSLKNFTFWLGIDPTGGRNPFSGSVVWGRGAHIYNSYAQVPSIEVTALAETATVFTRACVIYPFKHNDAYWDDAELIVVSESAQNSKRRGKPRIQYERFYVLLPPGADKEWAQAIVEATWDDHRYTIGGSADDAGIGDLDSRIVLAVNPELWGGPDEIRQFFADHYRGVRYRSIKAATPETLIAFLKAK